MNITVGKTGRTIIYTHSHFDKRFTYRDVIQLLPPNKSWPQPEYAVGDFPLILEFNTEYMRRYNDDGNRTQFEGTLDERPEHIRESFRKLDYQREIIMLLTLFTTFRFYEQKPDWVMTRRRLGRLYFRESFRKLCYTRNCGSFYGAKLGDTRFSFVSVG